MAQHKPTRFDTMDFPNYEFQEYPKHINYNDGTFRVVNNRKEEDDLLANPPQSDKDIQAEKNALIAKAEALGVAYDKRWGAEKVRQAIVEEEFKREEIRTAKSKDINRGIK